MKRLSPETVVPMYAALIAALVALGCASNPNNQKPQELEEQAEAGQSSSAQPGTTHEAQQQPTSRATSGDDAPRPSRQRPSGERQSTEANNQPGESESSRRVLPVELAEGKPDFACGFATISMIAHYYDRAIPAEIAEEIRETVEEHGGLHGEQLSEYFEMLGFLATPTRGVIGEVDAESSRSLLRYLDEERPVVLLMRHRKAVKNHFGVIVGHDRAAGTVALLDPGLGMQWMSYAELETSWRHGSHFMLVPIPSKDIVW